MEMIFESTVSAIWPWALAIAGAMAMAVALLAGARGALMRGLGLGVLVFLLLGPLALRRETEPLPDQMLVVTDESPSQQIGDRSERTEAARASLEAFAAEEGLELVTVRAGAGTEQSDIHAWIREALRNTQAERLSAVVLLSDGIAHDSAAAVGAALGRPVHALLSGNPDMRDRQLRLVRAPEYAIVDRPATVTFRVDQANAPDRDQARLRIRQDGEVVFNQQVSVGENISMMITPERRGPLYIEAETDPLPGEPYLRNNSTSLAMNAVRDRLRVLLVSGEPYQGERSWRSVLRSDAAVDLVHFTILRPPTSQDPTPPQDMALIPFPTEELFEQELPNFDLIIFDRYTLRGVLLASYLDNLTDYVNAGGAVLVATGPEFTLPFNLFSTPLARILPAAPTGALYENPFRPERTESGRRHPVTAELGTEQGEEAWGRWFQMVDAIPRGGQTLMEGADGRPLLVLARIGEGRIAQLLSDNIWVWSRGIDGGGPDREFIRRTAHWLMQEPELEEDAILATSDGETIRVERRTMQDAASPVTVTFPDGSFRDIELETARPGLERGNLSVDQPGLYRLSDGTRSAIAAVGSLRTREAMDVIGTAEPLTPLIERAGGSFHWLSRGMPDLRRVSENAALSGANWIGLPRREAGRTLAAETGPLIPGWLALLIGLPLLMLIWWREAQ